MIACPRCGRRVETLMKHTHEACTVQQRVNAKNRTLSSIEQPRCRWCGGVEMHRGGCPEVVVPVEFVQEAPPAQSKVLVECIRKGDR